MEKSASKVRKGSTLNKKYLRKTRNSPQVSSGDSSGDKQPDSYSDILANNFNFKKQSYSLGLVHSSVLSRCKIIYHTKISQVKAVIYLFLKNFIFLYALHPQFIIRINFQPTFISSNDAGSFDKIDFTKQPRYPSYEDLINDYSLSILLFMLCWCTVLLIIIIQVTTKVRFPKFLSKRFKLFQISDLGRGLDDWKGIGVGEDLKFWKRIEDGTRFSQRVTNRWMKLKTINKQTLNSLFYQSEGKKEDEFGESNVERSTRLAKQYSSFKMSNHKRSQEKDLSNMVMNIFLFHEYVIMPFLLVWISLLNKNSLVWNKNVAKKSSTFNQEQMDELFPYFQYSKDPFLQSPTLNRMRTFTTFVSLFSILWKKKYLRNVCFNPLNSLSTISENQELISFLIEGSFFLALFFDSDPLVNTNFTYSAGIICCILLFMVKFFSPNRVFQNIYGAEIFWGSFWLLMIVFRSYIYKLKTYESWIEKNSEAAQYEDESLEVMTKMFMGAIACYFISHRYSEWYYDFQNLTLSKVIGAVKKGVGQQVIGQFMDGVSTQAQTQSNSSLSQSRFTVHIYSLLNFVIFANGGDLEYPNFSFLPFMSDPSKKRYEQKMMYIKGLEIEHIETCKNINCRCREILIHEDLRKRKSDHDLRILDKKFFIQLSIIREMIHVFIQQHKFKKKLVLLYSYFLTNFQNRTLFSIKLVQQKILKTGFTNNQKNSFAHENFGGEANFEVQYFQYFQFKQMQNQIKKNQSFFTQMPSVNLRTYNNLSQDQERAVGKIFDIMRLIDLLRLNLRIYIEYRKVTFQALTQIDINLKKILTRSQICFEIESCLDFIFHAMNSKASNLHPNFTIFECFYFIRIKNHHHRKIQLFKKFNKKMSKYYRFRKGIEDSLYKRFMEAQVCVIGTEFSTTMGSYNNIKYVTKNSKKVIKHDYRSLVNTDLKNILPDLISEIHQDFFKTSLAFSQKQVHSLLQSSYLKTNDKTLIKVEMKLMLYPHISIEGNCIRVYSFISRRQSSKNSYMIMLDKGGYIKGVSKAALDFFGLEQHTIDKGNLSVNYLSKEFDLLTSGLNWRILLNINEDLGNGANNPSIGQSLRSSGNTFLEATTLKNIPDPNKSKFGKKGNKMNNIQNMIKNDMNQSVSQQKKNQNDGKYILQAAKNEIEQATPSTSVLYNTNNMPDLVPLFFEKHDIALISKWRPKIEHLLGKLHRSMYIEYKDPYRRMLKGGLLVESKASPVNKKRSRANVAAVGGPRRRRDSQKMENSTISRVRNSSKNKLVAKPTNQSILDLFSAKEVEIVKGLFKMNVYETILPTFTIMRVIELKLVSDSLGKFKNLLEKKRKGEITLADQIQLGFNPDEIDVDPIKNFIIQIDKSVCMMKGKKNRLPKELKTLEGKDELIMGNRRYQYCRFTSDLDNSKFMFYKEFLNQLRVTSNAYKICLFSSKKDRRRAFEKMSSLQSLVNQNLVESSSNGPTLNSTRSRTYNSGGMAGDGGGNESNFNMINKRLNNKLNIFQTENGTDSIFQSKKKGNFDSGEHDEGSIYDSPDNSLKLSSSSKLLDKVCNSKPKSKAMLQFFKMMIFFSIMTTTILNYTEINNFETFFSLRQGLFSTDFCLMGIKTGLMNIESKYQANKIIPGFRTSLTAQRDAPGVTVEEQTSLQQELDTLKLFESLNANFISQSVIDVQNKLEVLESSYNLMYSGLDIIYVWVNKEFAPKLNSITQKYLISDYKAPPTTSRRELLREVFGKDISFSTDQGRKERITKYKTRNEEVFETDDVWDSIRRHGRIILKTSNNSPTDELQTDAANSIYKEMNPYDQFNLMKQDLVQTTSNDNVLSLINLSTHHQSLLKKVSLRIKQLVKDHGRISRKMLNKATNLIMILFYIPIMMSVFYLIKYQRKLISIFANIRFIENKDLISEINNLNDLEYDLNGLGDGFSNSNIGNMEDKPDIDRDAIKRLVNMGGEDIDEYSDEQRKKYQSKSRTQLPQELKKAFELQDNLQSVQEGKNIEEEEEEKSYQFGDNSSLNNQPREKHGSIRRSSFSNSKNKIDPKQYANYAIRKSSNFSGVVDDIDSTKNYQMLRETEEQKKKKNELYKQLGFEAPNDLVSDSIQLEEHAQKKQINKMFNSFIAGSGSKFESKDKLTYIDESPSNNSGTEYMIHKKQMGDIANSPVSLIKKGKLASIRERNDSGGDSPKTIGSGSNQLQVVRRNGRRNSRRLSASGSGKSSGRVSPSYYLKGGKPKLGKRSFESKEGRSQNSASKNGLDAEKYAKFQKDKYSLLNKQINGRKLENRKLSKRKTVKITEDFGMSKLIILIFLMIILTGMTNIFKFNARSNINDNFSIQMNYLLDLREAHYLSKRLMSNNMNLIFWDKLKQQKLYGVETHFNKEFKLEFLQPLDQPEEDDSVELRSRLRYGETQIETLKIELEKMARELNGKYELFSVNNLLFPNIELLLREEIMNKNTSSLGIFNSIYIEDKELSSCDIYTFGNVTLSTSNDPQTAEEKKFAFINYLNTTYNVASEFKSTHNLEDIASRYYHLYLQYDNLIESTTQSFFSQNPGAGLKPGYESLTLSQMCKEVYEGTFEKGWNQYKPYIKTQSTLYFNTFLEIQTKQEDRIVAEGATTDSAKYEIYQDELSKLLKDLLLHTNLELMFSGTLEEIINETDMLQLHTRMIQNVDTTFLYMKWMIISYILVMFLICLFIIMFIQEQLGRKFEAHQKFLGLFNVKVIRRRKILKSYIDLYDSAIGIQIYESLWGNQ